MISTQPGGAVTRAVVDRVHLTDMAIWCGGLLMVVAFVLCMAAMLATALAVRQYSSAAPVGVAAIAAAGPYEAWRQDSLKVNMFASTTHGALPVMKARAWAGHACLGSFARCYIGTGSPRAATASSQLASAGKLVVDALEFAIGGVVTEDGSAATTQAAMATAGVAHQARTYVPARLCGVERLCGRQRRAARYAGHLVERSAGMPVIPLSKPRRSVFTEAGLVTALLATGTGLADTATGRVILPADQCHRAVQHCRRPPRARHAARAANPPGGAFGRDSQPAFTSRPSARTGPMPSPAGCAAVGRFCDGCKVEAAGTYGADWPKAGAIYSFDYDQQVTALWLHDHSLGLTRLT